MKMEISYFYRKVKEFCQKASIEELRSKGAAHVINWNGYDDCQ